MAVEFEDMIEELSEAARLDNSENGEWWSALLSVERAIEYGATERFKKAWQAEVKSEYRRLKRDFRIEDTEKVVTHKVRRLEFIG